MILIGALSKKIGLLKEEDVETLNNIVINISLPCMIFNALYTADVSLLPRLSILTVYMLITSLIVGVLTYLLLKSFGWDKRKIWSMVIVVVLGNTGFLGYPITQGIFGNEGMIRAVFCDISTSIIFVTLSFILILIFDGEINLEGLKNHFKEVGLASIIKLVIYPLIALGVLSLLNITGFEHTIGFIEATMSSAMIGLVLAISYKLDWELTSDCIFTTTLFSLVTIPTFLMFLL